MGPLLYEGIMYAMAKQAEVDSRKIIEILQAVKEEHEAELREHGAAVADARAEAARHAQMAGRLKREVGEQARGFRAALQEERRRLEEQRRGELKQQAAELDAAMEEAKLLTRAEAAASYAAEQAARTKEIGDVQLQLKALREAFNSKSEQSMVSHSVHKIAMGAFALEGAIGRGGPLKHEVAALRAAAGEDPLIEAAVGSLPPDVVAGGAPTRARLAAELEAMKGSLRQLALLPPEGGGVLAHALAGAVSLLKVSEAGTNLAGGGVEAALSRTEGLLAQGDLPGAARALREGLAGTKGAPLGAEWARHAENRALAEQSLALIQAHATALAAALS